MSNSKQVLFIYAIGKENLIFKAGPIGRPTASLTRDPPESAPVALYPHRVMKQPTSYILEQYQTAMLGDISAIVLEKYHLVGK